MWAWGDSSTWSVLFYENNKQEGQLAVTERKVLKSLTVRTETVTEQQGTLR